METLSRDQWIDAFCASVIALGVAAKPEQLVDRGSKLWNDFGEMDPVAAAQAAADEWPSDK